MIKKKYARIISRTVSSYIFVVFHNGMHQELTAFEWMFLDKRLQLNRRVLEIDQSQAQFPLYSLQVMRQFRCSENAKFYLETFAHIV